ncbi:Aldo kereductase, partial [Rhizoctonia solani]
MSPIPTLPLNDKRAIPAIAFGTGSALFGKDATAYVVQAIEGGFNHVDTAQVYQNEESVGEALRQAFGEAELVGNDKVDVEKQKLGKLVRDDIWVTTKYGGHIDAEEALDISLKKLGLSYVDLYLIHWPHFAPDILKTWSELERAHAHGKAKQVHFMLKLIIEHGRIIPAVNQIPFHPYNYHEQAELLKFAEQHGIRIESYSGLTPITKLPGGPVDVVIERIATRLGPKATPAQVLMSWIRAKGVVVVTTTSRKERIQEYLATLRLPPLTEEDVAAIDEAGKHPPSPERKSGCVLAQQETSGTTAIVAMILVLIAFYFFVC